MRLQLAQTALYLADTEEATARLHDQLATTQPDQYQRVGRTARKDAERFRSIARQYGAGR